MNNEFLERKVMNGAQYQEIVDLLVKVLQQTTNNQVSFLIYGSFLDNRLQPGLSDIDGVLFFWDKFVINKAMIINLAHELREQFKFIRLNLRNLMDISIIDAGNGTDGRFIPYNDNFSKIFNVSTGDSRMIHGKEFIQTLFPVQLVDPTEAHLAYNLQTLRSHIVFGRCSYRWPGGINPETELRTLRQIQAVGRKIMMLIEPDNIELAKNKQLALKRLAKLTHTINFDSFWKINHLMQNKESLIDMILATQKTSDLLVNALDCYEQTLEWVVETQTMRSLKSPKNNTRKEKQAS